MFTLLDLANNTYLVLCICPSTGKSESFLKFGNRISFLQCLLNLNSKKYGLFSPSSIASRVAESTRLPSPTWCCRNNTGIGAETEFKLGAILHQLYDFG